MSQEQLHHINYNVNENISIGHHFEKLLYQGKTEFQTVELYEGSKIGRALFLDGAFQSNEFDDATYHEHLVHPAMLLHANPKRVFIGGGGEFATAREILKHASVELVDMVDIDGELVELCKKLLPSFHKQCYEDKRLHVNIGDALVALQTAPDNYYDVIVLDLSDPHEEGPCYQLYTLEFYTMCKQKLTAHGTLVTQGTSMDLFQVGKVYAPVFNTLRTAFDGNVLPLNIQMHAVNTSFCFVLASKQVMPASVLTPSYIDAAISARIVGKHDALQCYDGETHLLASSLDKRVRAVLAKETRVITNTNYAFMK